MPVVWRRDDDSIDVLIVEQLAKVGRGLELPPLALAKTAISENLRTESGTVESENTPLDPDLAKIVAAWPQLPEAVRSALLAIVRNAPAQ
jgi:hypothetical protein